MAREPSTGSRWRSAGVPEVRLRFSARSRDFGTIHNSVGSQSPSDGEAPRMRVWSYVFRGMNADRNDIVDRVTNALVRLRGALALTAPKLAARLAKPATVEAVSALRRAFGRPLPDDLMAFYAVADGDGPPIEDEPESHGLLLGAAQAPSWVRGMRWLSARQATAELRNCRDTMAESFESSWVPIATDDNGNFVVVDADHRTVFALDHENPVERPENRVAASVAELLEDLALGLDRRTIQCDRKGLFRIGVPTNAPPDPAMVFVGLLVERGVLVLLEGHAVEETATSVRGILAGRGGAATKAKKLARLFEEASWVDESFASENLLEALIEELR
jgi:cell wall assembly regulator SMI1